MSTNWNGILDPNSALTKSAASFAGCEHGSIYVEVGEPEFGVVPVYVQFDHRCPWGTAPSNGKVYTFEVELDSFIDGEYEEAADLQEMIDNMTVSERYDWVNAMQYTDANPLEVAMNPRYDD